MQLANYQLGEGTRVTVLLHGLLGSGRNLRTLAAQWASRDPLRRFFVPDLPGHGQSPPWPQTATTPGPEPIAPSSLHRSAAGQLASAVWRTLDLCGLDGPVDIVGHSLGARVALAAAGLEANRVLTVTMLDMPPGPVDARISPTRTVVETLLRAPDSVDDRRVMRAFLVGAGLEPTIADWLLMNLSYKDGAYRWRVDRRAIAELHDNVIREDLWPLLETRAVPIRCIRGERSEYVSKEDVARMEALGCSVSTIPGAGHYVHVDALDALLDVLMT